LKCILDAESKRKAAEIPKNVDNETQIDTARPSMLAEAAVLLSYIEED
jgi:hypothetical protein